MLLFNHIGFSQRITILFNSNIGFPKNTPAKTSGGKHIQKPSPPNAHLKAIALISIIASLTIIPLCAASADTPETFSIIWITDTQYLSESHPAYFSNLCQWIVENKENYNIKMVVHTGDIVNDEGNRSQWLNANQSMGILLDNNIPYCWDAGNHDYNTSYWIGNQFSAFNPQTMQAKPYWVSDDFNGTSTAVRFDVSGWDFMVVNVAFEANASVVAWANNLLDANPQSHVIMATHAYLNKDGAYDSWASNFKNTVLDTHANVFLTLSGHYHPTSGKWVRVGDRDELFFNQQDAYDQAGAESARILTFDIAKGTVTVQTYNLYLNQFMEDSNNSFTFNSSFENEAAGNGVSPVLGIAVLVGAVFIVVSSLIYAKERRKKE